MGELSSWVTARDSSAPSGGSELSIEKLESQLNILKVTKYDETYFINLAKVNFLTWNNDKSRCF